MSPLFQWALRELGLLGPEVEAALKKAASFQEAETIVENLKVAARKKGRILLGRHHPDRASGDEPKFLAINEVLQVLDKLRLMPVRRQPPRPRVYVRVTHYPQASPWGGTATTTSTTGASTVTYTSYFNTANTTVRAYDARKGVKIKP